MAHNLLEGKSNQDIMNAIRAVSTNDYQRLIPDATKANIRDTVSKLWTNAPARNEFVDALVNRIGLVYFQENSWNNPLAPFKRGALENGDTIEEIIVGLLNETVYDEQRDSLEHDLFSIESPEVQTSFHKLNRKGKFKLSVVEPVLRRAFIADGGLATFVSQLMAAPTTSDQLNEFTLMSGLFRQYFDNGGFWKVHVDDLSNVDTGAPEAKYALRRIREFVYKLPFLSRLYNAAHMPVFADPDELYLFTTPEAQSAFDVEALAAAFNIDKTEVPSRTVIIPAENFNIPGVQAVLTTKNFFVVADNLLETRSIQNPSNLSQNFWLHHWQVMSLSRFVPAVVFWTGEGDVETVEITPVASIPALVAQDNDGVAVTEVTRGERYQIVGTAVTDPAGGYNDAIVLSVTGKTSVFTFITQTGVLYVGPNESADTLTVSAYAEDNAEIVSAALELTPVGDKSVLWPDPHVDTDSDDDGLFEVTPEAPAFADNTVTIPSVVGVQYKNGATNLNNGSTVPVASGTPVTITAAARAGYELAAGATTTWTFTAE